MKEKVPPKAREDAIDLESETSVRGLKGSKVQLSGLSGLLTAALNYGLGGMLPQVIGFLLVPVYTRFLTPGDYGVADVVGALGAVLVIFFKLGVSGSILRFFFDYRTGEALARYVSTVAWFLVAWTSVSAGLLTVTGTFVFDRIIPGIPFFPFGFLGLCTAALGVLPDLQRSLLQAMGRSRDHLRLTITEFSVSVLCTVALVIGLRLGVVGVLIAPLVASVVMTTVAVRFLRPYWMRVVDREMLNRSVRYGAPMLPHHLSVWLMSLASRVFLSGLASTEAVGIFGIAARFSSPLTAITSALNAAWVPAYFRMRSGADETRGPEGGRLFEQIGALVVGSCLGLALLGRDLVPLVTPPAYHAAANLVPVLALAGLLRGYYFLMVGEIFFSERTWWVTASTAVGAFASVAGSLLFIPRWGAMGSAWSMVLSNTLVLVMVSTVSLRLHRVSARPKVVTWVVLAGLAGMFLGTALPAKQHYAKLGRDALAIGLFVAAAMSSGAIRFADVIGKKSKRSLLVGDAGNVSDRGN